MYPETARRRATLVGCSAILMWSTLALLTTLSGPSPPFLKVAIAFAVPSAGAMAVWIARGESIIGHLRQPWRVWVLGIVGLFGYHVFYFIAFAIAPPIEASLIAYLAPLLIVLFSALLPGEQLRWWHVAGALLGLAGAVLVVTGGGAFAPRIEHLPGHLAALACAITWAAYSVLSRRFGSVSTDSVGGFCAATAVLALLSHIAFEVTVWPSGGEWLALLGLGLGPVGLAFFTWDHGVKHGDIKALGALFYAAPVLSTLLLMLAGKAAAGPSIVLACLLVVAGALLASRDLLRR
jgi:drug/metabolite transporter (DMT)-like permease